MTTERLARYLTFCLLIEQLCETYNASVISWWRTKRRNRDAGGHDASFHLEGLAVDLEPDNLADLDPLIKQARALGLQAVPKKRGAHLELDYRPPTPRGVLPPKS